METPSSTRRVTRSQTLAALNNSNIPLSKGNKEKPQERSALIDITNDSPIVGLAMETPSSAIGKQRSSRAKSMMMTPGSGEALLRGQVKTLLQKVEEEAEVSKVSMESRPFLRFQAGCGNSPMGLMAPTPANTPHFSGLSEDGNGIGYINNSGLGPIVMALPVVEQQFRTSEVVSLESQRSVITRSLLLDFSEQSSESGVTDQRKSSACKEKASSIWSIQVNASIDDEDDEEPIEEMGDDYYEGEEEDDEEEEDDDGGLVDELCEGLSKISMKEMFRGRHTRFIYNSDDEIEREEDMIRLKGLPTPKGKQLRFPIEEEEDA
ncbi:Guanine nucleotide exchange factor SDC25 [Gossypium australe]|uniref:Guanine nucleotide exchange factor SDC25 n=1 Tax=Gossypium australe TaxID=47621 RepID=A0A5B6UV10_9ROSI|nr:Guanine nucleotide exchange factor SDC25 [Gossypium australe]